jgi:hypothetical protein
MSGDSFSVSQQMGAKGHGGGINLFLFGRGDSVPGCSAATLYENVDVSKLFSGISPSHTPSVGGSSDGHSMDV